MLPAPLSSFEVIPEAPSELSNLARYFILELFDQARDQFTSLSSTRVGSRFSGTPEISVTFRKKDAGEPDAFDLEFLSITFISSEIRSDANRLIHLKDDDLLHQKVIYFLNAYYAIKRKPEQVANIRMAILSHLNLEVANSEPPATEEFSMAS